ncbi:MAG TPA: tetratricopeptide repeat protein [Parasegetibacter sp.]
MTAISWIGFRKNKRTISNRIKCVIFSSALLIFSNRTSAQQTYVYKDPQALFKEAKDYFQKEQYSLAYPIFKELRRNLSVTETSVNPVVEQELKYYVIACGLKQNEGTAVAEARQYIEVELNTARVEMLAYHLGEYYYRQHNITEALRYYEQANIEHLKNSEIAAMKFHQGYGYFTQQQFGKAKPLLNAIRQMKDDPNYKDANYYYGFISFYERNYGEALDAFRIVEDDPRYVQVVPYYIAEIYYFQNQKDKAIEYAEAKLKSNNQYYDNELRQMVGHAYFEKKDFAKASYYLEQYVEKSAKVTRQDLYELSYSYYQTGNYTKSIEGFKQLSGKEDSLSQSSMYLLGDAYLRTNQKANARNAFLFCASNSSDNNQREVSLFNYAKLSYELGYQDVAINEMKRFLAEYPNSVYQKEGSELLVSALANTNNYKDALTLLEGLSSPGEDAKRIYPRILYGRAMEFINDGLLASAESLLDRALQQSQYNRSVLPFIHFWKGEIAFRTGRTDEAIRYYTEYLNSGSPANGEVTLTNARYNLGYAYMKKENYVQALNMFEQVARVVGSSADPVQQDAFLRAADCYYMQRNYTRARQMYSQVVGYSWASGDYASFQMAMIAGVTNPSEKIKLLSSLERMYPNSTLIPDANMEIAQAYLANEQFSQAIPYLENIIASNVTGNLKPEAYLKMGIANYNLHRNTEALNNYETLIMQYPNTAEAEAALENIGNIYVELGRTDDYVAFLKKAGKDISVSEEDALTFSAAEVQYLNGNLAAALNSLNTYINRFPDGAHIIDAEYYRATIYENRKEWAAAAKSYEAVALRAPNKHAEKAVLQAARLNYFDLKDFNKAETYFTQLKQLASNQENRMEAMRGLLRSQFELKKWSDAVDNARDLLREKGASTDDKVLAGMVVAKSHQQNREFDKAISEYKNVVNLSKGAYAAEARYQIAEIQFQQNNLTQSEKSAFEVINKSGSYDYWVTKAYILLGDIYWKQKDYFNAKATFQSIADNSSYEDLKAEAAGKLEMVIADEKGESKLEGN